MYKVKTVHAKDEWEPKPESSNPFVIFVIHAITYAVN